ncbi:EamA family transporter [Herbiconiux sp. VKM Ac-1786]|uniref:DMT family transporter n=1 Tax=Herbiconiux sp. VKM Ac-1786 TaxID=2783824 RepID=UPI00188C106E|nr:EamA family transporter [Herbiconiux sp. VKM Ac-1786]MBF4572827.1 EamA family transporter [Herbiconiux sp. VKM Ac-1786]
MEANWRWMLLTAVAPIAWGSNYFVTRWFLPEDVPLWGAVLRALPAGLVLLAVMRERPRGDWWWKAAVLGVLNVGAFFVLIYAASQLLPTSTASTLMASSAGVLMLVAWPLLGERPRAAGLVGAVVGIGGVVLMLGGAAVGVSGGAAATGVGSGAGGGAGAGGQLGFGVAASLGAMAMSSVGFVLTKKWGGGIRVLSLTSWQLVAGGLAVLPFALLLEGAPPRLDGPALAGFGYVSLVATALAFAAWFTGLRRLPAGSVGLIGLLNPVTGVLLGTLLAGEAFGPAQAVGTLLVLAGVLLGQRPLLHRGARVKGMRRDVPSGGAGDAASDRVASPN